MPLAEVNGTNIAYTIDGPESGPWMILSNSLASDSFMWTPQISFLTQKYRVLRYDTRGHGDSPATPGPYSFDLLVADVIGLMDHLNIEKAVFMGLSLGGMTALGLGIHFPERFERLICCDARADAPAAYVDAWNERIQLVRDGSIESIVEGTIERWLVESFRQAHPDKTEQIRQMIRRTSEEGWIGCVGALKTLDYLKDLGKIKLPILYVGGAEDAGAAPDVMAAMAEATPDGRFIEIPNAAHVANFDNASGFNAAIAEFLGLTA